MRTYDENHDEKGRPLGPQKEPAKNPESRREANPVSKKIFGVLKVILMLAITAGSYIFFSVYLFTTANFFWGQFLSLVMTFFSSYFFLSVWQLFYKYDDGDIWTPVILLIVMIFIGSLGYHYLHPDYGYYGKYENNDSCISLAPGEVKSFQVKEGEETPEITVGEDFQIRGENDKYEIIFSDGKKYLAGENIPKQKGNSSFRVKSLEGSQKIDVIYFH